MGFSGVNVVKGAGETRPFFAMWEAFVIVCGIFGCIEFHDVENHYDTLPMCEERVLEMEERIQAYFLSIGDFGYKEFFGRCEEIKPPGRSAALTGPADAHETTWPKLV